ncbi:hypothetical protein GIB67_024906, partial [Kingdonia uniflora]
VSAYEADLSFQRSIKKVSSQRSNDDGRGGRSKAPAVSVIASTRILEISKPALMKQEEVLEDPIEEDQIESAELFEDKSLQRLNRALNYTTISEEVAEMEHELIELHKHVSSQRILVQDLMTGVCRELEEWNQVYGETSEAKEDPPVCDPLLNEVEIHRMAFLENIDVLLAEHKVEEALEALDAEEKSSSELNDSEKNTSSTEISSYKSAFLKRKTMLEDQLVEITEQPSVGICELKKALSALLQLGKGPLAQKLLLKAYGSRLLKKIDGFLPSCSIYEETYSVTLSKLVFSTILLTAKESGLIFGDMPVYTNRIVQWAEWEIESFIRLVKENAPSSETVTALRAASICVQASFNHCSILESQGLKLSKLLMVLLQPYVEEVLEMNFRRARSMLPNFEGNDDILPPQIVSAPPGLTASSSDSMHADSGTRFIFLVKRRAYGLKHPGRNNERLPRRQLASAAGVVSTHSLSNVNENVEAGLTVPFGKGTSTVSSKKLWLLKSMPLWMTLV